MPRVGRQPIAGHSVAVARALALSAAMVRTLKTCLPEASKAFLPSTVSRVAVRPIRAFLDMSHQPIPDNPLRRSVPKPRRPLPIIHQGAGLRLAQLHSFFL